MTPRILIVTRAFGERAGGMERLSFELVTYLRQTGAAVDVIAHTGPRWLGPLFVLWSLPLVMGKARTADVIHLGDPMLAVTGWLVKKIYHVPVVVTAHGLDLTYPALLYQLYLRLFFGKFDRYVAISHYVKQLLVARGLDGIVVINPGLTDQYYTPRFNRMALERVLKRRLRDVVVLATVGRLVERKGQMWFIRHVLPRLPERFLYVIAGDGPAVSRIHQLVRETGLDERVLLLHRVSNEVLRILYNTVDAFVQPNILVPGDVEGFGLVLLEAASCQRHVFAANLEGMTDALVTPQVGTLVPTRDAAAWIAALTPITANGSHPAARAATLARFDWNVVIQKYLSLYGALITEEPIRS